MACFRSSKELMNSDYQLWLNGSLISWASATLRMRDICQIELSKKRAPLNQKRVH